MLGQDLLDKLLSGLDPNFADKICTLLEALINEGVVIRPYSGLRSPLEQAVLWCQSRTPLEAELIARKLDEEKAPYLASVLRRAAIIAVPGRWATNNLPGQSWHNFGLALDSHVVSEDGRAIWGPKHAGYERYASIARDLDLFPGYDFARQDVVHVQYPATTVRNKIGAWCAVDEVLAKKFPNDTGPETKTHQSPQEIDASRRLSALQQSLSSLEAHVRSYRQSSPGRAGLRR